MPDTQRLTGHSPECRVRIEASMFARQRTVPGSQMEFDPSKLAQFSTEARIDPEFGANRSRIEPEIGVTFDAL